MSSRSLEMFTAMAQNVFEDEENVKLESLTFYGSPGSASSPQRVAGENAATPNNVTTRSKPQQCKVCGKVLSSASSYYVHMKQHSGSKPYQCTQCDAAFCRKPYLDVSVVKLLLPLTCPFCLF